MSIFEKKPGEFDTLGVRKYITTMGSVIANVCYQDRDYRNVSYLPKKSKNERCKLVDTKWCIRVCSACEWAKRDMTSTLDYIKKQINEVYKKDLVCRKVDIPHPDTWGNGDKLITGIPMTYRNTSFVFSCGDSMESRAMFQVEQRPDGLWIADLLWNKDLLK